MRRGTGCRFRVEDIFDELQKGRQGQPVQILGEEWYAPWNVDAAVHVPCSESSYFSEAAGGGTNDLGESV